MSPQIDLWTSLYKNLHCKVMDNFRDRQDMLQIILLIKPNLLFIEIYTP